MPASMTDKLKSTWNSASPAPTVTTGTRSAGAGTLACQSLNWPTDTAVDFATFAKNADGSVNQASVQEFTGIVSGNNLTSVTLTSGGSDQGNNIGDTVVMKPTSKGHQDLVDAVKVAHNQDGSLKDNIVTTAKIANGAVTADTLAQSVYDKLWWEEIGRATLAVAGDTITVSSLPTRKYLMLLFTGIDSGAVTPSLKFNNDAGANYSTRVSQDGGADATATSATSLSIGSSATSAFRYIEISVVNISDREKMVVAESNTSPSGAATAPTKRISYSKWADTTAPINRIDIINTGAGDFAAGSELIVLGHN